MVRNTSSPGKLSFASSLQVYVDGFELGTAVGDMDGDGKKDIVSVFSTLTDTRFSYYKNTSTPGAISFAPRVDKVLNFASRPVWGDLALADYDGDNKLDAILFADRKSYFFRNTSTMGTFSLDEPVIYPIDGTSRDYTIDNFNGDASPDLLIGSTGADSYGLYKNSSVPGSMLTDPAFARF